jgi:ABC-type uncharacterized transport system permease subunit
MTGMGFRLERKQHQPITSRKILSPVLIVIMLFIFLTVIMIILGVDPITGLASFFGFSLGKVGLTETFAKFIPLALTSLGLSFAMRSKIWNIGAEGQIVVGSIFATWVGLALPSLPGILMIPLLLTISFLAGGAWSGISGILRAKWNVNEVVLTIMMNYVVLILLNYLLLGPLGIGGLFPQSPRLSADYILPAVIPGTRLHAGIFITLLFVAATWILLSKSVFGYKIKTLGDSPKAARYAGISVYRTIVLAMFVSGGFAGLAGAIEVLGLHGYLLLNISAGYGFLAIPVVLLGGMDPVGVTLAALFVSFFTVGVGGMLRLTGLPLELMTAFIGVIIVLILVFEIFTKYRIRRT